MPSRGVNGPRLFALLSRVRTGPPPDQWLKEALEETQAHEEAGFTFQETSWGYRLKRRIKTKRWER